MKDQIREICSLFAQGKLNNSPDELSRARLKLSSLNVNLGETVASATRDYLLADELADACLAEYYLYHRATRTQEDSKYQAKVDSSDKRKEAIEKRRERDELSNLYNSVEKVLDAMASRINVLSAQSKNLQ